MKYADPIPGKTKRRGKEDLTHGAFGNTKPYPFYRDMSVSTEAHKVRRKNKR